jgi:radical SAM superfamily enzyme YgiQ (UPF0313 family)
MGKKLNLYFNEYNLLMGTAAYLPLSSGILHSYAETNPKVAEAYNVPPYLFHRDKPEAILRKYTEKPDVAAFSVSMWNEELSLHIANELKTRYPEVLIVFGGPQVPFQSADYLTKHKFIDIAVRSEGEIAFAAILERNLESRDFSGIPSVTFRSVSGEIVRVEKTAPQLPDLDVFPSPYLTGKFDPLLKENPHFSFQAIVETNRGCPFNCTFCYWGQGGLSTKYRYFSMDRVRKQFEWIAQNKIEYVFNADSNFGMLARDKEIAEILVDTKKKYGYPHKFRTCYGKNSDDKIFQISKLLREHDLSKSVTIARQSNDQETLNNIGRKNISLAKFQSLQHLYNEQDIPVYSELIMGLPGETYTSWMNGLDSLLSAGIRNQIFVYFCQVLPNTDMAKPDYIEKFGMVIQRIPLQEVHCSVGDAGLVTEYEDIIVGTKAMPLEDWKKVVVVSWIMQVFTSLKLGYFILVYLHEEMGIKYSEILSYLCFSGAVQAKTTVFKKELNRLEDHLTHILSGKGRMVHLPEYSDVYLDVDESSFILLSAQKDSFFAELKGLVEEFLTEQGKVFDPLVIADVFKYQAIRVPDLTAPKNISMEFDTNVPEYFQKVYTPNQVKIEQIPYWVRLKNEEGYKGDKYRFMREKVLFGRKSGSISNDIFAGEGPYPHSVEETRTDLKLS